MRSFLAFLLFIVASTFCLSFKIRTNLKFRKTNVIEMATHEKIVVTGLGVMSPNGNIVNTFFDNICNGHSGISKLDRFDTSPFKCQIAGQIRDFNPRDYFKSKKKIGQNDLYTHYAVAASHMALADANIKLTPESGIDPTRVKIKNAIIF